MRDSAEAQGCSSIEEVVLVTGLFIFRTYAFGTFLRCWLWCSTPYSRSTLYSASRQRLELCSNEYVLQIIVVQKENIQSKVESLLFLSGEPIGIERLAQVAEVTEEEVEEALIGLEEMYKAPNRGLSLVRRGGEVQLTTRPENAPILESLAKSALQDTLSKAALEVLAVIAYRGPISRVEIEAIRGVNCSVTLRNLLMRELIERTDNPNDSRGYLYAVSFPFLREMGLGNAMELPDYEALRRDERLEAVAPSSEASDEGVAEDGSGGQTVHIPVTASE